MPYYSILEITVTDAVLMASYFKDVPAIVAKYGGVYRARTPNHEQIEGEPRERPQLYAMIEWPSKEKGLEFMACEEYQPYFEKRQQGAKSFHVMVEGE